MDKKPRLGSDPLEWIRDTRKEKECVYLCCRVIHMKSLFLLFLSLVFACSAFAQTTLTLQEKCSKAAKEAFNEAGYRPTSTDETLGSCFWSYECHYNRKLDKCFILVNGTCAKKGESSHICHLADVFEGKYYANYQCQYTEKGVLEGRFCSLGDTQFNMVNGFEFNKETKKWDIISEAYINSLKNPFRDTVREKFDKWVKPYMEE